MKNNNSKNNNSKNIGVVLPIHIDKILSYKVPEHFLQPKEGSRVVVPLRNKLITGYVVESNFNFSGKTSYIFDILDQQKPLFPGKLLKVLKWASQYYHYPLGEVCKAAHPPMEEINEKIVLTLTDLGKFKLNRPEPDDIKLLPLLDILSLNHTYNLNYIINKKKIKPSTINKAEKKGYIIKESILKKKGTSGTIKTITKVFEIENEEVEKWLKRGKTRLAIYHDLCETILPVPISDLKSVYPNISSFIKQFEEKNLVKIEKRANIVSNLNWNFEIKDIQVKLTDEQQDAIDIISEKLSKFQVFLLHGVTGSGKTEVYMHLMEKVLELGKTALIIVPEIALTPQLSARFRARFGEAVSVLHSGLTNKQRASEWTRLHEGTASIAVGARSAVFAPLENIGLIIVDEEHDSSFKQVEGFRYHARDVAIMRAKEENCTIILGSATPSIESMRNAEINRYTKISLKTRPTPKPLPDIKIVDLKVNQSKNLFAGVTKVAIEKNLASGNQTIIFLNRRGFSGRIQCSSCGEVIMCPHCSVALTYHKRQNTLRCHYCGYKSEIPSFCPSCQKELVGINEGTENVLNYLQSIFPQARIMRMDSDSVKHGGMERVINSMKNGQTDILLGTQMVTKGHDFPNVTLVVILNADQGIYFQDFRAAEKTFQLLVQVSGRAGRGTEKGKVIIQTFNPFHYTILNAANQDAESFYQRELQFRRELMYPPFGYLALFELESEILENVKTAASEIVSILKNNINFSKTFVLGPVTAPIEFLRNKYRYHVLIKSDKRSKIQYLINSFEKLNPKYSKTKITVDVDPNDML